MDLSGTTFSLYVGPTGSLLTLQSYSGAVAEDTSYPNGGYPNDGGKLCGTDAGVRCNLVELTFRNLNYLVNAGDWTDFGVSAGAMRLHATNAGQAGVTTPQEGTDGAFLGMVLNGGADVVYLFETCNVDPDPQTGVCPIDQVVPIDINVRIYGSQVPEPSSLALLGIALAGFAFSRRSKQS